MTTIKRCDNCKKLSDDTDRSMSTIDNCHMVAYNIGGKGYRSMYNMRISHPTHDLCIECLKILISEGNIRIGIEND